MSAENPTPHELAGFELRMVVERIRFRIDVMNERGLDGVSISKGFATQIVRACQRGSEFLENPEPAQAGLTADSGNGSANVSEGVTGGGESAVGDAAGEIGGHLQLPSIDDPVAEPLCEDCPPVGYPTDATRCSPCPRKLPVAIAGPSLLRPAERLSPQPIRPAEYEAPRNTSVPLRVRGVGRVADEPRALLVMLTERPTDDELRSMHDFLRDWRSDQKSFRIAPECLSALASGNPCQPDDTLKRCTICGFIVDTQYAAEKPTTHLRPTKGGGCV
jgi:hypothetical protein